MGLIECEKYHKRIEKAYLSEKNIKEKGKGCVECEKYFCKK